ncbi:UNVERIFIED_CONTAM: hypothetical protein K2H54_057784 [Gekko kuhli]
MKWYALQDASAVLKRQQEANDAQEATIRELKTQHEGAFTKKHAECEAKGLGLMEETTEVQKKVNQLTQELEEQRIQYEEALDNRRREYENEICEFHRDYEDENIQLKTERLNLVLEKQGLADTVQDVKQIAVSATEQAQNAETALAKAQG